MYRKRIRLIIMAVTGLCLLGQVAYSYDAKQVLKERQEKNKLSEPSLTISELNMHPDALYEAQLAVGYVTTVILPETPLKIFLGDQQLFKAEIYDQYVAVKPATEWLDAKSNLAIFTENGRLALDLSVGPWDTADLLLDFSKLNFKSMQEIVEAEKWKTIRALQEHYEKKETQLKEDIQAQFKDEFKQAVLKRTESYAYDRENWDDGVLLKLLKLSHVGDKTYLQFYIKYSWSAPFALAGAELREYARKGEGKLIQDFSADTEFTEGQGRNMNVAFKTPEIKDKAKVTFWILGKVEYPITDYKAEKKIGITFRWRTGE